jgi:hypothetical protein
MTKLSYGISDMGFKVKHLFSTVKHPKLREKKTISFHYQYFVKKKNYYQHFRVQSQSYKVREINKRKDISNFIFIPYKIIQPVLIRRYFSS